MNGTGSQQISQPTNQTPVQLDVIMAAHYTATRASVDEWVRRRDQYLMLYITGAGTMLALYLSKPEHIYILYLVPVLMLAILPAYLSADLHIAYLCRWLTVEYTGLLEKLVQTHGVISLAPWHWDNSKSLQLFYSSGVGCWRYIFFSLTVLLMNTAATWLATVHSTEFPCCLFVICVSATLFSWGIIFFVYLHRRALIKERGETNV